jgi:hypothetical protein
MKHITYIASVAFVALAAAFIIVGCSPNTASVDQAEIHEAFLMCNNAGGVRSITVSAVADGAVPDGHVSRQVSAKCVNGMTASKVIHLQMLTREAAQPLPVDKV